MKDKSRLRNTLIVFIMIVSAVLPLAARGSREQGAPEPVPVKNETTDTVQAETGAGDPTEVSDYPPAGWVTDIREAYKLAQAGDKQILINYTGSDWCVWCRKLSKEVFTTPEFQSYADENLVMLFLDFPQDIPLSGDQVMHNQFMAQLLGVRGYPTIWLLDSDLSPLLQTGYRDGGAEAYIAHLNNDRPEISDEDRENFRIGFTEAIEENLGPL